MVSAKSYLSLLFVSLVRVPSGASPVERRCIIGGCVIHRVLGVLHWYYLVYLHPLSSGQPGFGEGNLDFDLDFEYDALLFL